MTTIRDMWLTACRQNAADAAVVCDGRSLSYSGLLDRARKLGSACAKAGAVRQDRISMMASNCPEWAEYYAACHIAGLVAGTVNFRLAGPEVAYILKDSRPRVVIFAADYADLIDGIRGELDFVERFVCIGASLPWAEDYESFLASGDPSGAPYAAQAGDIASLVYTSGTTGRPKGVIRTQESEFAMAEGIAVAMSMRPGGSILLVMPLFHIGASAQAFGMILVGGTLVIQRSFDPAAVLVALESEKISYAHLAPTMVQAVLDRPEAKTTDFSNLEVLCYSAAPMPLTLLKRCLATFGPVMLDMYGGTEMGAVTSLYRHRHVLDDDPTNLARLASVGQPHPNCALKLVDSSGNEVPSGTPGEIAVKGPTIMRGYWNNTAATIEALRDGWYHTGDIAVMDDQAFVSLVDRKKDMIVSGGENIYCREVEEALMESGELADVAVIGIPDEKWGEAVLAIAIRNPGSQVDEPGLIEFSRGRIARYKCPKAVRFVDELPRLPSGKISKVKLRESYR